MATWAEDVEQFAIELCEIDPITINCAGTRLAACKDVEQTFWCRKRCTDWGPEEQKIQVLCRAMMKTKASLEQGIKALIFCNKKETVPKVVDELQAVGINCGGFSSDCP